MNRPILLKCTSDLEDVVGIALKIYYDENDWLTNAEFVERLASVYKSKGISTNITSGGQGGARKKPALYYGLLDFEYTGRSMSNKINQKGRKFYEAYINGDKDVMIDMILSNLSYIPFGKNNPAVSTSMSPIDPPKVFVISNLILDGISKEEYAYVLQELSKEKDYNQIIVEIIYSRSNGFELALDEESENSYKDDKGILFLCKCGLTEDEDTTKPIKNKYKVKYRDLFKSLSFYNTEVEVSSLNGSQFSGDISPIIYYGAPGTGKTRFVQLNIFDKFSEATRSFTTFHQSYSYEDFVEGLKPVLDDSNENIKYTIEDGVFIKACENAAILAGYKNLKHCIEDSKDNRKLKFDEAISNHQIMLLCIDEINRGNVASIFGDLISLIEPSKRLGAGNYEMTVTLPYSKKLFGVPSNLFIVGTMNTADRSIQLLDSALRRRFRFKEMEPDYEVLKNNNVNASAVLKSINDRIRCVLNKDNQIGHAYLIDAKNDKEIVKALIDKIVPLLEEYFYNDIEKVRFVLNEVEDSRFSFYEKDLEAENEYKKYISIDDTEEKTFYSLKANLQSLFSDESECSQYINHLIGGNV